MFVRHRAISNHFAIHFNSPNDVTIILALPALFKRKQVATKPPKLAMSQIQRKKYAAPCRAAGKPVWAVGLSFDGKTRQFAGGVA